MITVIKVPFLGANDKSARLVSWLKEPGEQVCAGEVLCQLETTKTLFDIDAVTAGYFYTELSNQSEVAEQEVLAIISDAPLADYHNVIQQTVKAESKSDEAEGQQLFTQKAEILANRNKLDIGALARELGRKVQAQDVKDYLARTTMQPLRMGFVQRERIGIIGGVSGGGALIIIDAILRQPKLQAVAVFDQNPAFVGQEILGVPVVGSADDHLQQYLADNKIDKVIIGFNRNLEQREQTFTRLSEQGVPFCNIIDPTVEIRNQVKLGTGNVVLSNVYIGPCSEVGDNNFITAGTHLEHGNKLGSHCAFGPSVSTSGNVSIGDRVRFAAGIVVEPGIEIGNDTVISSGAVIVSNVAENHVVKLSYTQQIKVRDLSNN
ncbi:biotin/lipoyl-containing protein [Aliidiomarina celeris]|uniref:biotin/lipoyl-containing protein n=1 Tax=Aliidiomarina celeris TaxID=2249428 RepID=UPI000DEAD9A9|nr:biotin/lipoyl-containing protein [Aliidiomarina celeris]